MFGLDMSSIWADLRWFKLNVGCIWADLSEYDVHLS
jgi:hypothetical protein